MKRFSCRCRYTSKRYKKCNPTHLIDSQSCGRRAGDLNLSSQRTQRCPALSCPALPRPVSAPSRPKYGFIKTTYGIYESAGPKAMLLLCLGRPSRNGKQKMTKKRQQRTKRSADSGVGLGGGKGREEQKGGKAASKVLPTYLSLGHFWTAVAVAVASAAAVAT